MGSLTLDVFDGETKMDTVSFTKEMTMLGRALDVDYRADHASTSRKHCTITRNEHGEWFLTDLKSSQGTHLNGIKLAPNAPEQLQDGAQFRMGASQRVYKVSIQPGPEAAAAGAVTTAATGDAGATEAEEAAARAAAEAAEAREREAAEFAREQSERERVRIEKEREQERAEFEAAERARAEREARERAEHEEHERLERAEREAAEREQRERAERERAEREAAERAERERAERERAEVEMAQAALNASAASSAAAATPSAAAGTSPASAGVGARRPSYTRTDSYQWRMMHQEMPTEENVAAGSPPPKIAPHGSVVGQHSPALGPTAPQGGYGGAASHGGHGGASSSGVPKLDMGSMPPTDTHSRQPSHAHGAEGHEPKDAAGPEPRPQGAPTIKKGAVGSIRSQIEQRLESERTARVSGSRDSYRGNSPARGGSPARGESPVRNGSITQHSFTGVIPGGGVQRSNSVGRRAASPPASPSRAGYSGSAAVGAPALTYEQQEAIAQIMHVLDTSGLQAVEKAQVLATVSHRVGMR